MGLDDFLYSGLISAVLLILLAKLKNLQTAVGASVVCFLVLSIMIAVWRPSQEPEPKKLSDADSDRFINSRPIVVSADGYISSKTCVECHPHEHATWKASYHRTMTQLVTPQTMQGDFDDVSFNDPSNGRTYHLWRNEDEFWVTMDKPGFSVSDTSEKIDRPIVMSTGSHHMQVYWYPLGYSRILGQLPIVHYREENRWIPRNSTFLNPPHDPGFDVGAGRWNTICIDCHTTHPRMRPQGQALDSWVGEFGIACEACHGPGERHVRFQTELESDNREEQQGMVDPIVDPAQLLHRRSAQVCGHCHSVSLDLNRKIRKDVLTNGFPYRPGDDLTQTRFILRRNQASAEHVRKFSDAFETDEEINDYFDSNFWKDGMVRIAGREFNGLLESACHQKGEMTCISCHVLHKPKDDSRSLPEWANDLLRSEMTGDQACIQCHDQNPFQTEAHTHHAAGSTGSRCYNCHMPHTTYGLLKAIRSHTIDSPDVSVSLKTGRPNACNLCHLDKTLEWSADHLADWFAIKKPDLDEDQRSISAAVLWILRGDAGQRALIAWNMGWSPAVKTSGAGWLAPYLGTLLEDPYDAIRIISYRSLRSIPEFENFQYDFLGPKAEQAEAVHDVLMLWNESKPADMQARESVLIDREGQLQHDVLDRLKSQRDNRKISLHE